MQGLKVVKHLIRLFCFILSTLPTFVKAISIEDLLSIESLDNIELKLEAYEQIEPKNFQNQESAAKYFIAYGKALSKAGFYNAAEQLLVNETNTPTFYYSDVLTAKLYKSLADIQYHNNDYDKSRLTTQKAIKHFKKSNNIQLLTNAITRQGAIELRTSNYLKAIDIVKAYHKEQQVNLSDESMASIYFFYGRAYDHLGEFQTSLEYKLKSYEIENKLNVAQSRQANTLYGIANSYGKIGEHKLAYEKFLKVLEIDRENEDKQDIGHSLTKLVYQAYKLKKYDIGIDHAKEAISLFQFLGNARNQAWSKHNMALIYAAKGDLVKALELEEENRLVLLNIKGDFHLKTTVWNHLAELYLKNNNPTKALEYAKQAYKFGNKDTLTDKRQASLNIIHRTYSEIRNFEQAYIYQQKLLELQTADHKANYSRRLAYLQNTIETKDKAQKLAEKEQENLIISNVLAQQKNQQMVFILLFIVFVAFTLIIYIKFSQRRALEQQQALHLSKLLEQRNQLFSQIAHDLSNPVTVACLHIEAMQHEIIECKPNNLTKIREKLTDLNHLVNDLAGLAKLETASFSLNTAQTDLEKFVNDIHEELKTQATEQTLTVAKTKFKSNVANIDSLRVKQIIANLYSNAKKYTHSDGEIDLNFGVCERNFKIVIQDSPPSVPKEHLDQIFDHLFRVPNMTNTETPGHGIGLSIVKQIVDLHRGDIKASESELGGLKIEVELPLK